MTNIIANVVAAFRNFISLLNTPIGTEAQIKPWIVCGIVETKSNDELMKHGKETDRTGVAY